MSRVDIKTSTDEELLAFTRPRPWESLYPKVGGLVASLVVTAAILFAAYRFFQGEGGGIALVLVGLAGSLLALALGFFAILGVVLHLTGTPERRSWGHRQELLRRYGQAGFDEDLQETRAQMETRGSPEWAVFFTGQGLPHGRIYWAKITLEHSPQEDHLLVESRVGPRIDFEHGENPLVQIVRRRISLPLAGAEDLVEFLRDQDMEQFRNVKSCFIEGLPCEVAILRQGDRVVHRSGCNYVAADTRLNRAPVMRMVGIILRLIEAGSPG